MSHNYRRITEYSLPNEYKSDAILVEQTPRRLLLKARGKSLIIKPTTNIHKLTPETELNRRKQATLEANTLFGGTTLKSEHILISGKVDENTALLICKISPWLNKANELQEVRLDQILNNRKYLRFLINVSMRTLFYFFKTGKVYDLFSSKYNAPKNKENRFIRRLINPNTMLGTNPNSNSEVLFIDCDWYIKISDYKLTGFPITSYIAIICLGIINLVMSIIFFSVVSLFNNKGSAFV